ncbi:MAG TPA: hypothetical protein VGM74_06150 [Burkholderiaceae bacterium]|jgi:hypothetical protein
MAIGFALSSLLLLALVVALPWADSIINQAFAYNLAIVTINGLDASLNSPHVRLTSSARNSARPASLFIHPP